MGSMRREIEVSEGQIAMVFMKEHLWSVYESAATLYEKDAASGLAALETMHRLGLVDDDFQPMWDAGDRPKFELV